MNLARKRIDGSLLLVHSPLVGPSTWGPVADEARRRGIHVVCPDLTRVADATPPLWSSFAVTAVAGAQGLDDPIVVGHSGAGAFLPAVGERLGRRLRGLVFVDAVVPPVQGFHRTPPATTRLLDEMTIDGVLRPWLDWWPAATVEELLPSPDDRAVLAADMPRLPRSFYDETVPVPASWSTGPCGYLKLSEAYENEFVEADARHWPRADLDADHLSIYTEPEATLSGLESLLAQLLR